MLRAEKTELRLLIVAVGVSQMLYSVEYISFSSAMIVLGIALYRSVQSFFAGAKNYLIENAPSQSVLPESVANSGREALARKKHFDAKVRFFKDKRARSGFWFLPDDSDRRNDFWKKPSEDSPRFLRHEELSHLQLLRTITEKSSDPFSVTDKVIGGIATSTYLEEAIEQQSASIAEMYKSILSATSASNYNEVSERRVKAGGISEDRIARLFITPQSSRFTH